MVFEQSITGIRWEILKLLAKRERGTSELAELLSTSPAHISQQLRNLEFGGLVCKKRTPEARTHHVHAIIGERAHFTYLSSQCALKMLVTEKQQLFFHVVLIHPLGIPLLTCMLQEKDILQTGVVVCVLNREQPELLLIHSTIDSYRQRSKREVYIGGHTHTISLWSHTKEEYLEGIRAKNEYFLHLQNDIFFRYDPECVFEEDTHE